MVIFYGKRREMKFVRQIVGGLQLVFLQPLALFIGGRAALEDFRSQVRGYITTGESDTGWVRKYIS